MCAPAGLHSHSQFAGTARRLFRPHLVAAEDDVILAEDYSELLDVVKQALDSFETIGREPDRLNREGLVKHLG